jgi:HD-GYP domain-containing protein (c-di-GMP phosphodiesterase class II)
MAMVYRLVRSLGDISSSVQIVDESLRNMIETLECSWVAAVFGDDADLLGELAGRVFSANDHEPERSYETEAVEALATWGQGDEPVVVPPEQNEGLAVVIQPIRLRSRVVGRLLMVGKNDEGGDVSSFDTQLLDAVAACISSLLETIKLYAEQNATFMGTLQALSGSLDAKDRYTRGHSERVSLLGGMIARAAGLGEEAATRYELAGTLHDIGKIGVPDAVLCKPGKLTDEEFALIKRHPRIGYEILKPIPSVRDLLPGVLHHHERWDGRGYPDGLEGEAIDPMARALAIADTFDAMSSNRAYRSARSRDEVLAEIEKCRGSQFDPDLAGVFLSLDLTPFDELLAKHGSERVNEQDASGESRAA